MRIGLDRSEWSRRGLLRQREAYDSARGAAGRDFDDGLIESSRQLAGSAFPCGPEKVGERLGIWPHSPGRPDMAYCSRHRSANRCWQRTRERAGPSVKQTVLTHLTAKEHNLMESNARTETSNPIALSRLAGLCAVGYVLTALLGLSGALGGNLYFSDAPASDVLAWIGQNGQLISLSIFLTGLVTTLLYGGLIVLLVQLTAARGILPVLAYLGLTITVVTVWTQAGMIYAMVDLAARGGVDA